MLIKRGRVISKDQINKYNGKYPVFSSQTQNNGILGYIDTFDFDGEYLTWTTDGAYAGTVFYHNGKFSITNVCGIIKVKSKKVNIKFLYYILQITTYKFVNRNTSNPKLMSNVFEEISIPIPSLSTQNKIVAILDKFSNLINDLNDGIPKEINLRKQQYEYYRNLLLEF